MKQVIKELELDPQQFKPAAFLSAISQAKNKLLDKTVLPSPRMTSESTKFFAHPRLTR